MRDDQIKELFEEAGYDPISYSGRGMFGKRCLAVNLHEGSNENTTDIIFNVIRAFAKDKCDDEYKIHLNDLDKVLEYLECPQTDSMGKGQVLYWPEVNYEEPEGEEEDEDEDEDEDERPGVG